MKTLMRATAVATMFMLLGSVPAQAHVRIEPTSLTLNANRTVVDQGQKVRFSGRLNSDWNRCRRFKRVHLFRDGTKIASKSTTRTGRFTFVRRVNFTSDWHVEFNGKKLQGPHPHNHRCLASSSDAVRVRVRGGGGGGDNDVAGAGGGGGTAGVVGAGGTEVLAAGGESAVTGSDIIDPAKAAVVLGAIGLVALFLARRRLMARPDTT